MSLDVDVIIISATLSTLVILISLFNINTAITSATISFGILKVVSIKLSHISLNIDIVPIFN